MQPVAPFLQGTCSSQTFLYISSGPGSLTGDGWDDSCVYYAAPGAWRSILTNLPLKNPAFEPDVPTSPDLLFIVGQENDDNGTPRNDPLYTVANRPVRFHVRAFRPSITRMCIPDKYVAVCRFCIQPPEDGFQAETIL